ncbi:hypothetical protein [Paracoccus zhejiangensis]|uniref:Uncharacterized protein n=1 Tax=Paracoccus zhejiangensis TaxID=1077935 RepID=A0A2H5EYB1_9RHOB|nr:hypothetical protein [Paracoccus zhejiangensis]AUH64296.1 hypothetical protein CX676_09085 [Paracoccus zhejiangensis]
MIHALDFTHAGNGSRSPVSPANRVISGQGYLEHNWNPFHTPPQPVVFAGLAALALIGLLVESGAISIWPAMTIAAFGLYCYLVIASDREDAEIENVTPIDKHSGCIDPADVEQLMTILMRHRMSATGRGLPASARALRDAGILRHEIGFDHGRLTHSIISQHPGSRRETRVRVKDDDQLADLARDIFGDDLNRVSVYTGGMLDSPTARSGP